MHKNDILNSSKLWDEIQKAIVSAMPEQLFPLFKEVYGKEYAKGTSIKLLSTEYSTFMDNTDQPPGSKLADIALLVDDSDFYHIECQMKNDSDMVIRMVSYDLHFAIQHNSEKDADTGEIIIHFPRSIVIYPEKNNSIPDKLRCRIIFQDNSEHIYEIPTIKIQSYSLQEIKEKHLMFFIPYVLLRLRPKLKNKHSLTISELTEFVEEVILILKEELKNGSLTVTQFNDYLKLFRYAANNVFMHHLELKKEVLAMTEPLIILPSMVERNLRAEIAAKDAEIADKDAEIADKEAEIADKDAEIAALKAQLSKLTPAELV